MNSNYSSSFFISLYSASFSHNADCARSLNPCLDRQNKVVASSCISNCIEFGTIKIRVIQHQGDRDLVPVISSFYSYLILK